MNKNRFLKAFVCVIVLALIVLRMIIIFQTRMETFDDWYYVGRQLMYTITWALMAYFLFREFLVAYTYNKTHRERRDKNMELLSLVVAIGCVINVITMLFYHATEIIVSENEVISAHNFIEVGAWVLLAVYFFFYYFFHRGLRRKMERQRHNMLLENMRSARNSSVHGSKWATAAEEYAAFSSRANMQEDEAQKQEDK